jgi:hypothetical protein
MALVLLFEFVKLLGEFPVCAGRLPEGRIAEHKGRYVVLNGISAAMIPPSILAMVKSAIKDE